MLASNAKGTSLLQSEKQTLLRFFTLYILLSIVIVSGFSFLYYTSQKELMLEQKKPLLQKLSKTLIEDLRELHINFTQRKYYPRSYEYESSIYDSDKNLIFASSKNNVELNKILYLKENKISLVNIPESYYLGAKYIVLQIEDDGLWLKTTLINIALFSSLAFVFMMVVGYMLSRLFLKPMRDAIELLDRFIKDTTHELNTPISTIVTNIEMINRDELNEKTLKKINRIEIGAKTVSNIYEDLTYLTLGNKIISHNENIILEKLIYERVDYFKALADAKKIDSKVFIEENSMLYIDKSKLSRLLDNLISNAIKYNKINGSIYIKLKKRELSVKDSGIGIEEENISKMQQRYARFNSSNGGFGIGLDIVATIAKEYKLNISITSKFKEWTEVKISW